MLAHHASDIKGRQPRRGYGVSTFVNAPAGRYTLWTKPSENGVTLIVNRETGQWGTGFDYGEDLGRTRMRVETVQTPVEKFTTAVTATDSRHGALVMEWGTFRWSVPVVVSPR